MSDWKQHILATHEERQSLAMGPWLGDHFPGVALPLRAALRRWVVVRHGDVWTVAQVQDVGPWCIDDEAYIFQSARPRAEILKGKPIFTTDDGHQQATVDGKEIPVSNGAGIDLFPQTAINLGIPIGENVLVDWKFIEPPF